MKRHNANVVLEVVTDIWNQAPLAKTQNLLTAFSETCNSVFRYSALPPNLTAEGENLLGTSWVNFWGSVHD